MSAHSTARFTSSLAPAAHGNRTRRALIIGAVATLLGLLVPARANPVTYSYTGANYNLINSSTPGFTYDTTDALTFSITLANALVANTTTDLTLQTVTWTANDGKFTSGGTGQVGLFHVDDYNPGYSSSLLGAVFTTDSLGNIVAWHFNLFNGSHASELFSNSNAFPIGAQLYWATLNDYVYSRTGDGGGSNEPIEWAGTTTVGSWTTTSSTPSVPDNTSVPAGLSLSIGLFGLVARMKVRR
ncbi:MAG TPA: hypothetical protein VG734_27380 [Lacunisphaera sp.]|nr:hypothetical protein [Lacunisphaera sp.]